MSEPSREGEQRKPARGRLFLMLLRICLQFSSSEAPLFQHFTTPRRGTGGAMPRVSLAHWAICLCVFAASLPAQVANDISGQVVDPDHARIPRATVRLLLADGSEIAQVLTDQQGRFRFQQACPGSCMVEVQLTGFRTKQLPTPLDTHEIQLELAPIEEQIV